MINVFVEAYRTFTVDLVMWLAQAESEKTTTFESFGDWLIGIIETAETDVESGWKKAYAEDLLELVLEARETEWKDIFDIDIAHVGKVNYSLGNFKGELSKSQYYQFLVDNYNELLLEQQKIEKDYLEKKARATEYEKKYSIKHWRNRPYPLPAVDHAIAALVSLMIGWKEQDRLDKSVAEELSTWYGVNEDFYNWARCDILNSYALASSYQEDLLLESNQEAVEEQWEFDIKPFDEWLDIQLSITGQNDWVVVANYSDLEGAPPSVAYNFVYEVSAALESYPLLDEEDHSRREMESTEENIREVGERFISEDAPDNWVELCWRWFWENNQSAIEPRDGGGGYPSDEEMVTCLRDLGLLDEETV